MEERREIKRVEYNADSTIIDCTTQEKYSVKITNVSPKGMGIRMNVSAPDLIGRDIVIIAETLIMYAEVVRQQEQPDGSVEIGISARRFSGDVLDYLFNSIEMGVKA